MKKRNIAIFILMIMFCTAVMLGCGGGGDGVAADGQATAEAPAQNSQGEAAEGSSGEDVTINLAVGSFATKSAFFAKEQFENENPGTKINIIEIPFGSLYEKLSTSFMTNTAAYDAIIYPSNWLSDFIKGGYVISLEPYLKDKDNWDGIIPAVAGMQVYEDERYAIPLDGDSIILYYRKDALENEEYKKQFEEKYGYPLTVPQTWTEYQDVAEFFNGWDWDGDGEVEYGTLEALAPKDVGGYIFWTRAMAYAAHPDTPGYSFFDPETMEPQANNPAYVRALEEWVAIKDFGPPNMVNYGGGEQRGNFAAGQSAMAIDWHDTGVMAQDAENSVVKEVVGYALAPGSKEVYNPKTKQWDTFEEVQFAPYLGFSGWTGSVTSTCKNPEVAAAFLNLMDTDENALTAVTTSGTARNPYRYDQLENPQAWEESEINFYKPEEYLDAILKSYTHPNVQIDLRIPRAGAYLDALDLGVMQAISGDKTPQQALDEVAEAWNRLNEEQGVESQKEFYLNTYSSIDLGV